MSTPSKSITSPKSVTSPPNPRRHSNAILTKLQSTSRSTRFSVSAESNTTSNKRSVEATVRAPPAQFKRENRGQQERESIKIRLITFNMFDSLPESDGDLSELLGFTSPEASTSTGGADEPEEGEKGEDQEEMDPNSKLPTFRLDSCHPYHVIAFAGQECPTASGLSTGRVNLKDLNSRKGWSTRLEDYLCNVKDKDKEEGKGVKGMYILAAKERLLPGIFLAIFILKDCSSLLQGIESKCVTAGLLNGRLGNKGGIGISLSIFNHRFLFINVHLAAHASAIEKRKEDMRRILDGLNELEDFSGRISAGKTIPDRWDQVFILGDMNFRLDITRVHADWLMSTKSYSTALEFDQLRKVMKEPDSVFQGFEEAPIHFPPTYKYDALKVRPSLARALSSRPGSTRNGDRPKSREREMENSSSTSLTSPHFLPIPMPNSPTLSTSPPSSHSPLAQDALSPPRMRISNGADSDSVSISSIISIESVGSNLSDDDNTMSETTNLPTTKLMSEEKKKSRRATLDLVKLKLLTPFKKRNLSEPNDGTEGEENSNLAVFDSGSKQRVQSYCDRIIFSTSQSKKLPPPPIIGRNSGETKVKFTKIVRSSSNKSIPTIRTPEIERTNSTEEKTKSNYFWSNSNNRRRSSDFKNLPSTAMSSFSNGSERRRSSESPLSTRKDDPIHSNSPNSNSKNQTSRILKSFFHLPSFSLANPFLPSTSATTSTPVVLDPASRSGPRFGEVQVIEYGCIEDLSRMKATSDHRPVFLVVAVGIEED